MLFSMWYALARCFQWSDSLTVAHEYFAAAGSWPCLIKDPRKTIGWLVEIASFI